MSEIEKKIRDIINDTLMDDMYKDAYEIIKDENLFNLGLDSLNIVKLMIAVEDEYNIVFEDNEIISGNWKNIASIEQLIKNKI